MISVFSLLLPIVLSGVALFFASFLSWMVLKLHKNDWRKLSTEDAVMSAIGANAAPGNYMVPGMNHLSEMNSPEFQKKMEAGPRATITVLPKVSMGQNLGLTMVNFLVVSFLIAYLSSMVLPKAADSMLIFRVVFTAGILAFLSSYVAHSIWFRIRIVGHVIESIAYAAIIGTIFARMWPK